MTNPPPAPRPPNRVRIKWQGDQRFDVFRPDRPASRVDGDGLTGPGPVDTVLGALTSCVSIDVVLILAKRRTPVTSLEVEAIGERVEGTPRRLKHIRLNFKIGGDGIDYDSTLRTIELSVTKYCSVRDSLDPEIPVEWGLELVTPG